MSITIRKDAPSGTIMINRPDRRNALSREMIREIRIAIEDFQQERSVRAIILTGAGDTFSAGTDLQQVQETAASNEPYQQWHSDAQEFQDLIEYMPRFPKPIISSINGPVVGSGLALVLASDIVVASEQASISTPEPKLGLCSGLAAALLGFRIGAGQASYILTTGQKFDAKRCHELGLFHELVQDHLVWARCQELSKSIASGARHSFHLIKQMLNETMGESLFTHLAVGSAHTASARMSEEATEGIKAFLENREPDWEP